MEKIKEIDWKKEKGQLIREYLVIILGTFLMAVSFKGFFLANDIAPGGVTGIATVVASFLPLGVGFISFLVNLPLFALGWKQVGWRFAVRSFIAMVLLSLLIDVLPEKNLAGDMLLSAVFGGVLMGTGLGLIVRSGSTTGGTDLAASLIHHFVPFIPVALILFAIDGLVVAVAAMSFGLQAGLFALVTLFVSSKTMDAVIKGFNTAMQFLIISSKEKEIISRIHTELDRGCTSLQAQGTYSGMKTGALLCVVSRMEAARLKKILSEVDSQAFVTVCDVHEALGEGFSYHQEKAAPGSKKK